MKSLLILILLFIYTSLIGQVSNKIKLVLAQKTYSHSNIKYIFDEEIWGGLVLLSNDEILHSKIIFDKKENYAYWHYEIPPKNENLYLSSIFGHKILLNPKPFTSDSTIFVKNVIKDFYKKAFKPLIPKKLSLNDTIGIFYRKFYPPTSLSNSIEKEFIAEPPDLLEALEYQSMNFCFKILSEDSLIIHLKSGIRAQRLYNGPYEKKIHIKELRNFERKICKNLKFQKNEISAQIIIVQNKKIVRYDCAWSEKLKAFFRKFQY